MSSKMLQFTHLGQQMPDKRSADDRRQDFDEIYAGFADDRAAGQASRCEQCGIPFCQVHCPLGNHIPDWLMLTAHGRLEEAYALAASTNTMPEVCGRICPQDRLCEGSCVLEQSRHRSVTIGAVEKYITDTAWEKGWVAPIEVKAERPQSVAIIGGGPGGLAAAEELRKDGFRVHVYDRYDRMGGLMVYGIPGFKLEKDVVARRVQRLEDAGVVLHPNSDIGVTLSFDELRARHDAVLIATGVYKARRLSVPGAGLGGVHKALDYLIASNRVGLGDRVDAYDSGALDAAGKDVVVIGGGDTAMDCVRTAIRQGAKSVKCVYRRDRDNMPGSQREVANAEEEGVDFVWLAAPEAVLNEGTANTASGVRCIKMHLGVADASGRQSPQPIEGSQFTLPADLVIEALGFEPEDLPGLFGQDELTVTGWGTLKTHPRTLMTSLDGVFAAGDIVRGASLVVWAIRDGRDAAASITRYLTEKAAAAAVAAE
jgi:glutamate synthase (NADPH/NADH) small chain